MSVTQRANEPLTFPRLVLHSFPMTYIGKEHKTRIKKLRKNGEKRNKIKIGEQRRQQQQNNKMNNKMNQNMKKQSVLKPRFFWIRTEKQFMAWCGYNLFNMYSFFSVCCSFCYENVRMKSLSRLMSREMKCDTCDVTSTSLVLSHTHTRLQMTWKSQPSSSHCQMNTIFRRDPEV